SVGAGPARIEVPPNGIPADGSAGRITPEMVTLAALTQDELDRLVAQVPGGVRNVQDIYPLAPLQEGILFHHLMAEDGDPYLLPSVYGFRQREAVSRFVDTVQQVIGRHDILRTAVYWEGLSQPVQVVQREARLELVELDASDFGTADLAAALEARFDPQHTRLDLGHAPLLRAHLVEDARNGRWLLHILAHHL
ncbi:condensation domain-containing protein, partial [Thauera sinica]